MNLKNYLYTYFVRFFCINCISFFFLYDSTSFNTGLISFQSFIFSINNIFFLIYFIIETFGVFFDYYGLNFNFIYLLILDFYNIDYTITIFIFADRINYLIFLFVGIILFFTNKYIVNLLNLYPKVLIFLPIIFILIIFLPNNFSSKIKNKIINFNQTINEYNLFRSDNWFIVIKNTLKYSNINDNKNIRIVEFDKIISNNYNNIFIIINESYPNFKDEFLFKSMINKITYNNNIILEKFKKDWSRSYTTQGAEMNLFCGDNNNFIDFKNKSLKKFLEENNCYFLKFDDYNKTFIHSTTPSWFNRERYNDFFDKMYFLEDLKNINYTECNATFKSVCDHEITENLYSFIDNNEKNLIIFLTTNNHYPSKLFNNKNTLECDKQYPLYLNDQFCIMYKNQMLMNQSLSNLIKNINNEDLIIFFPDTPPIFPKREMIHFRDLLDVYTFKKI